MGRDETSGAGDRPEVSRAVGGAKLAPLARKQAETGVERVKRDSRNLRGSLREALLDPDPGLGDADQRVAKFHGLYQQENRDARAAARTSGGGRRAEFMMRVTIPAGQLGAEQYLAMDRLADDVVWDRSLRITTRQNFQLHGVLKGDLKRAIQRIDAVMLSTFSGCGDVERNIVAPPAPLAYTGHLALHALAKELSEALTPSTAAYREIWLDGECVDSSRETEPFYGSQYLPRKFKTGLALPEDDSAEVHAQDVGLVGIVEAGDLRGANVLVGGGAGLTHRKAHTFARLATPLGYVERVHLVDCVRVVAGMFRDFGDRTDRRHSRLKYIVEEWGIETFREEFIRRADFELHPPVATPPLRQRDWLGAHAQGDGRWLYGIHVESGRLIDDSKRALRTAIRTLVGELRPRVVLTPQTNLLLADLPHAAIARIERVLDDHGLPRPSALSSARRHAMACPALPTCGLALAESERVASDVIAGFEREFARLGVDDTPITIRMTGCPNGCARPYSADLGLVGRKPGHYDVFVGGNVDGHRLGELHLESVAIDRLVPQLTPLFGDWARRRESGEGLGDFYDRCHRRSSRRDLLTGAKDLVSGSSAAEQGEAT